MNYFKAAEQDLSAVPVLKKALTNLKRRQDRLSKSGCPPEDMKIDYSKPYVDTKEVNDTLAEMISLTEVKREIKDTESKIEEIEEVLNQLKKEHKIILVMWYIEKRGKDAITETLNYESNKSIYNLRNRAVAEFALLYYGAGALKSI